MKRLRVIALALAGSAVALAATQQPAAVVTESQLREWAEYASTKAAGNADVFETQFKSLVKIQAPAFWPTGALPFVVAHSSPELKVYVTGPLTNFFYAAKQAARRMEPTGKLALTADVEVSVSPDMIGAPDIDRIVLRRGTEIVPQLRSTLKPSPMETRVGAKRIIHSGSVYYPLSAFAPGATVTLIAMPVIGTNVIKELKDYDLANITAGFSFGSIK